MEYTSYTSWKQFLYLLALLIQHLTIHIKHYCFIRTIQVKHVNTITLAGEGIPVNDNVGLIGNDLDIRHKICVQF